MIRIKEEKVNDLPLIELVKEDEDEKQLPTVIFYHGWTSSKESVLVNGYELAKRKMRVLLPEAYLHGERKVENKVESDQDFWEVVFQNIQEFPKIYDRYTKNGKSDPERFGVSGLSMGGITTCAMLTQFDWIKTAGVLMGSPSPISFTKWLLHSRWNEETLDEEKMDQTHIRDILGKLKKIALDEQPEKIANRPIYFWHGTEDDAVPFHLTEEFIKQESSQPYAKNIVFSIGEGETHKVPYTISVEMAEFFSNNL